MKKKEKKPKLLVIMQCLNTTMVLEKLCIGLKRKWKHTHFNILKDIADFCVEAHSLSEIAEHLGLSDRYKMKKKYIDPLLGQYFDMTIPNSPNNPGQKYYLTELGKALLNK